PLGYYRIAGTRPSCGECEMHGFAQTFWTKTISALADKITAEPVDAGAVPGLCVGAKIFGLGFVPDGSQNRSRRYDNHVNAVNHQFASECLRHSFQPMLRGDVCSEKRNAEGTDVYRDSCIIDQARQRIGTKLFLDLESGPIHTLPVSYIHHERRNRAPKVVCETISVSLPANAAKHPKAVCRKRASAIFDLETCSRQKRAWESHPQHGRCVRQICPRALSSLPNVNGAMRNLL